MNNSLGNSNNLKAASQRTIRNHNYRLILKLIKNDGPISRAELAKKANVSGPTVSKIIDHFMELELVKEGKPTESSGGRKPIPLIFNSSAGYVLGIDVGGTNIKAALANLDGEIVDEFNLASEELGVGQAAIDNLAKFINDIIEKNNFNKDKIVRIGIVVPGVTNIFSGVVSNAPAFGWQDIRIKELLEDKLEIPVSIENDVNAAAFAEKEIGNGQDYSSLIFMSIGTGIGLGLILNNELYRGSNFAAGEVGYTIIDIEWFNNEDIEDPGKSFGCLESMAAAPGIVKMAQDLNIIEEIANKNNISKFEVSSKDIINYAKANNEKALKLIDDLTTYLAAGIVNISVLINPEAIFLSGGVMEAGDILLNRIKEKVSKVSPFSPDIMISSFRSDASLEGALALAAKDARQDLLLQ
ncbi:MAG: ROK family protein [Halanaerobiales bacterium]